MLDKSHIAHLSVRYKNIAHLFSLKHSKISSHIFDDAAYFFDDAKECCLSYDFVVCSAELKGL